MHVCDSCSAVVSHLTNTLIYIGLKDGNWASVEAELCLRCKDKLVDGENSQRARYIYLA
jgi:hypothetical protein